MSEIVDFVINLVTGPFGWITILLIILGGWALMRGPYTWR